MDTRFPAPNQNETPDYEVWFHPTATINQVRLGAATDGVDWSPYVNTFSHAPAEVKVTLVWNHTFDSADSEPVYGQVLEIRSNKLPLWIGVIESIDSYNLTYGVKNMSVTCRSRETQDIWKLSKMVTQLYPQGTSLNAILLDVAAFVGLAQDEIVVPHSAVVTSHSNTQLANVTAWQMVQDLMQPMGLTPAINGLGQLTGYSRQLQNRKADIVLSDWMINRISSSRVRPPTTRYVLSWLDPNLTKVYQQGKLLSRATMTSGFFLPYIYHDVYFSEDKTQRAEGTYMVVRQSANALWIPVALEEYTQVNENTGRISIIALGYTQLLASLILADKAGATIPDEVTVGGLGVSAGVTIPVGRIIEKAGDLIMMMIMLSVGTGQYEIWGTPYDWKHAKNTTEAYDISSVQWLDNPEEVECDLIMNEAHADAIATQELIYLSKSASQSSIVLVDDRRMCQGDILQMTDGTMFYVTGYARRVTRGQPVSFSVTGFAI